MELVQQAKGPSACDETESSQGRVRIGVYFSFPAGGIGRYNVELLRALSAWEDLELNFACLPNFWWAEEMHSLIWPGLFGISHDVPVIRKARYLIGQWHNPVRALRHFKEWGAQAIHWTNVNHLSFPAWRGALAQSGLKMVISAHDVRRQVAVVNRSYEDRQLAAIYRAADALLVHSKFQRNELVEFADVGPERVVMVPHGPYSYGEPRECTGAVRKRYGIPSDALLGLFFGRLRDEKHLDGLLRAMAIGATESHLLVAGTASDRHQPTEHYRAIAASLGLEERVYFDDRHIPDEEVAGLMHAADWIALPYRSTFTSQSGVLNVATHYERPVLSGAAPVLRESVESHPIGVASRGDDEATLAEALATLEQRLANAPQSFSFSEFRQAHSWSENARLTRQAYRRVLGLAEP